MAEGTWCVRVYVNNCRQVYRIYDDVDRRRVHAADKRAYVTYTAVILPVSRGVVVVPIVDDEPRINTRVFRKKTNVRFNPVVFYPRFRFPRFTAVARKVPESCTRLLNTGKRRKPSVYSCACSTNLVSLQKSAANNNSTAFRYGSPTSSTNRLVAVIVA